MNKTIKSRIKRTFSQGKELILEGISSMRPRSNSLFNSRTTPTPGSEGSRPVSPTGQICRSDRKSVNREQVNREQVNGELVNREQVVASLTRQNHRNMDDISLEESDIIPSPTRYKEMVNFEQTANKIEKEFVKFMDILKNNETDIYHSMYPIRSDFLRIFEAWYFRCYYREFQMKVVEVIGTGQYLLKLKTHLQALSGVGIMLLRNNNRLIVAQPDLLAHLADLLNSELFTLQVYQDVLQFLNGDMNVKIKEGE